MSPLNRLTGLIAAPFTPMNPDGSVNLARIELQAGHLLANGVRGAFICGTTGEGLSLSSSERRDVATRWMEVAGKELTVIVHTGHTSLVEAQALAVHAQHIGAHATAAMAPCFYKPATIASLVAWCAELAVVTPALPFFYYQIPSMTGVALPVADFLEQADERIPNLAGVKFTHENLLDFAQAQQVAEGRYDLLSGRDEMLLGFLALGVQGAVGSTYNFAAPIYLRIIEAYRTGRMEEARRQQGAANKFIAIMLKHGGQAAGKAIMGLIGIECGPSRLPMKTLSSAEIDHLRVDLEEAGFFQSIAVRR